MPNATQQFFNLAENQSHHRQALEKKHLNAQNTRALLGTISAWSLSIVFAIFGFILLLKDKDIGAYTFFASAIIPRIISFFIAYRVGRKELQNNQ